MGTTMEANVEANVEAIVGTTMEAIVGTTIKAIVEAIMEAIVEVFAAAHGVDTLLATRLMATKGHGITKLAGDEDPGAAEDVSHEDS
ncbi:hypothetical protein MRX96_041799 [Rhipicephalus microplus]